MTGHDGKLDLIANLVMTASLITTAHDCNLGHDVLRNGHCGVKREPTSLTSPTTLAVDKATDFVFTASMLLSVLVSRLWSVGSYRKLYKGLLQ